VNLPEPDPDQEPLLGALKDAGLAARLLPWDDPAADPGAFDVCVLRSTWNYPRNAEAFARWIERAGASTRLLNPAAAVRWNMHKGYLRDLQRAGVRIVPTVWLRRGEEPSLARIRERTGWKDVVIKPSVSAASLGTRRFAADDAARAQAFLEALCRDRDVMVQQHLPPFDGAAERCLVWIDGGWTHAVAKAPRFDGGRERVGGALEPGDEEIAFAAGALSGREEGLLYARADLMRDEEGRLCLSEMELIEPSLFLAQAPQALERLVAAIVRAACG
jgi:hypothetical protein